jgi:hypothetical protein
MKIVEDERKKAEQLDRIISIIYKEVKDTAKIKGDTNYSHAIPIISQIRGTMKYNYDVFYTTNMEEILERIKALFPDCLGRDGKMYDISSLCSTVAAFVDHSRDQDYIVVDWS